MKSHRANKDWVRSMEGNKKSSQTVTAASEENIEIEKIRKTKKVSTLFSPLMAVVLVLNLLVVAHVFISIQIRYE